MPIYEFECTSCGHHYDHLQKLSDTDPANCPACGAPHLRRVVTAPSFRLAGSGWYETDFKKEGDKKRNLAGGAEPKPTASEPAAAATPAPVPAPASTKPAAAD